MTVIYYERSKSKIANYVTRFWKLSLFKSKTRDKKGRKTIISGNGWKLI